MKLGCVVCFNTSKGDVRKEKEKKKCLSKLKTLKTLKNPIILTVRDKISRICG